MSHQQPSFPYGVSENKENDGYFAFSDTPWSNGAMRGAGTRSGNTFKPAVRQSWPQTWLIISYLPGK
ncbi:MAG: hypothetical protein WAT95_02225 [Gemmiger qucibialis]|nr:hypothetical protein [Subdoligranulum sp.]